MPKSAPAEAIVGPILRRFATAGSWEEMQLIPQVFPALRSDAALKLAENYIVDAQSDGDEEAAAIWEIILLLLRDIQENGAEIAFPRLQGMLPVKPPWSV